MGELPVLGTVLAVCAHPDDESFGLGAVLGALAEAGTRVQVLCFTHGEASTLGAGGRRSLAQVRHEELARAAGALGLDKVELLDYPDAHLGAVPLEELASHVLAAGAGADALVVFDEGGITGHPDHCRATEAAVVAASRVGLDVVAWALPASVAAQLNAELGTTFVGRAPGEIHAAVPVDRTRQRAAIACHASQSTDNPVLWRRLELLGGLEHLRWICGTPPAAP